MIECSSCHALNPPSAGACLACGTPLNNSAAPASQTPPVTARCAAGHPIEPSWTSCPLCERLQSALGPAAIPRSTSIEGLDAQAARDTVSGTAASASAPRPRTMDPAAARPETPTAAAPQFSLLPRNDSSNGARQILASLTQGRFAKPALLLTVVILAVGAGVGGAVLFLRSKPLPPASRPEEKSPSSPIVALPQGSTTSAIVPASAPSPPSPVASRDSEDSRRALVAADAASPRQQPERIGSVPVSTREPLARETPSSRTPNSSRTKKEPPAELPNSQSRAPTPSATQETPTPADPTTQREQPDQPASSERQGVEQFNEINDVIVSLESFSEQALRAYQVEGRGGELESRLRSFNASAVGVRKEFRKATGTGFAGLKAGLRSILHRGNAGRETDTKVLELKVHELVQDGAEIDRLIETTPPGATTMSYWREVRRELAHLGRLL